MDDTEFRKKETRKESLAAVQEVVVWIGKISLLQAIIQSYRFAVL